MTGTVFNIQGYSIHDGPGIRTTVFLKGCPLDCLWCQNPESKETAPQLMFYANLCVGCGACAKACPNASIVIKDQLASTDRKSCQACGKCVDVCAAHAREITGKVMEAAEVAQKACADKLFFEESGGGVTLSGGEVMAQPSFAREVLRLCKEKGVHTCIETSGFASWDTMKSVLEYVDLVLYDFKCMDSEKHKKYTGVNNEMILSNAKRIVHELGKPLVGRIPLITGINDTVENITQTAKFISEELKPHTRVHLLPYNSLGESKNANLGKEDYLKLEGSSDEKLQLFKEILENHGLEAIIGG